MICYMYFTQCFKNPAKLIKCIECASRVECVEGVLLKVNRLGCCKLAASKMCPGAAGGCIPAAWSRQQMSSIPPVLLVRTCRGSRAPWNPHSHPWRGQSCSTPGKQNRMAHAGPVPQACCPPQPSGVQNRAVLRPRSALKSSQRANSPGRLGDSM